MRGYQARERAPERHDEQVKVTPGAITLTHALEQIKIADRFLTARLKQRPDLDLKFRRVPTMHFGVSFAGYRSNGNIVVLAEVLALPAHKLLELQERDMPVIIPSGPVHRAGAWPWPVSVIIQFGDVIGYTVVSEPSGKDVRGATRMGTMQWTEDYAEELPVITLSSKLFRVVDEEQ